MKITYTGLKGELSAKLQTKLDGKFGRKYPSCWKKRGEIEALMWWLTNVRHLYKAEITIPYYDHKLKVGLGSDADLFTALHEALEKLESQAVKNRGKWREKHRRGDEAIKGSRCRVMWSRAK